MFNNISKEKHGSVLLNDSGEYVLDATANAIPSVIMSRDGSYGDDQLTGALKTIEYQHHEIHDGHHFYIQDFVTLGNNGTIEWCLKTPQSVVSKKRAHLTWSVSANKITEIEFFEGGAISGENVVTPFNSDRHSSIESVLEITQDPSTITSSGEAISRWSFGTGGNILRQVGGAQSRVNEILLRSGETYLFRITSKEADNIVSFGGEWYEHTDPNL